MTQQNNQRLRYLIDVAEKEVRHLKGTTERLSVEVIDKFWVERLEDNPNLDERVGAFVARLG